MRMKMRMIWTIWLLAVYTFPQTVAAPQAHKPHPQPHPRPHHKCGVERWPIKTLADPESAAIPSAITNTTIEALRTLTAPTDLHHVPDHRHAPAELTRYRLHALLLGYKQESDSDFHLVLASPIHPAVTMIAEIPVGACVPTPIRQQESDLQSWVMKQFGHSKQPGRMLRLRQPKLVVVEGVGFFDFLHGQTGVAPNGIEIHPVTSITLDNVPASPIPVNN